MVLVMFFIKIPVHYEIVCEFIFTLPVLFSEFVVFVSFARAVHGAVGMGKGLGPSFTHGGLNVVRCGFAEFAFWFELITGMFIG